jgi:hypothetical protein
VCGSWGRCPSFAGVCIAAAALQNSYLLYSLAIKLIEKGHDAGKVMEVDVFGIREQSQGDLI